MAVPEEANGPSPPPYSGVSDFILEFFKPTTLKRGKYSGAMKDIPLIDSSKSLKDPSLIPEKACINNVIVSVGFIHHTIPSLDHSKATIPAKSHQTPNRQG
ncbi:hypothetical protein CIHG_07678 [Coccidioides immitis H538.4]|uniref:Uncharacterized protein n=3 Tax=Coccidioides immitis TaxID=5501 RepID=A0A0J8TQN2_COCIT|nr:hypothetical protein CIRG_04155 [Coccidioides immitis RMSCC 2394]KMU76052.1 hypothetical protein CISG_05311 [Coccidioides immitis RMSCC 3703]KMU89995.1 hypothetical protein CIHG_07678 [Coccidioides immitis H538.4]